MSENRYCVEVSAKPASDERERAIEGKERRLFHSILLLPKAIPVSGLSDPGGSYQSKNPSGVVAPHLQYHSSISHSLLSLSRTHTQTQTKLSKTGRSKCKKCGKPIDKDALRIVTIIPARGEDSYELRQNVHAACFSLPRQYTVGATKMTPEDFVADILEDISEDGVVLPERAAELAAAIGGPKPKKDDKDSPIYAVKQAFLARSSEEEDEEKEPAAKKTKTTETKEGDATAVPTEHGGVDSRMVDAYATYHKHTLPALKEILKWNRQHVTGTKDVLLHRILDGVVRGRLPRCPLDGGRLKLDENDPKKPARHNMVTCNGTFDEDSHTRLDCGYCQKGGGRAPRGMVRTKHIDVFDCCCCDCLDVS